MWGGTKQSLQLSPLRNIGRLESPEERHSVLCSGSSSSERQLLASVQKYEMHTATADPRPGGYVWRPRGCKLRLFTASEACRVVQRNRGLFICGESLQRHLYEGLLLVLTGNYEQGALANTRRPAALRACRGEMQFADCRGDRRERCTARCRTATGQ